MPRGGPVSRKPSSLALQPSRVSGNSDRLGLAQPAGETPLEWMLLTTEPVATFAEAQTVVEHYEKRWLIEEFHKAWKSGCRVEERPFQTLDALERMTAITAHIAVRILQLRTVASSSTDSPCETVLKTDEWQCLWSTTQHKPLPDATPTAHWAMVAIARLAGWQDTKRTGRVGVASA